MGGNVEFVKDGLTHQADRIPVSTLEAQEMMQTYIKNIIEPIKSDMERIHHVGHFMCQINDLYPEDTFSGSTAHLFSDKGYGALASVKPTLGDVDVKINRLHKDAFVNYLTKLKSLSYSTLIDFKNTGDNIITLWYAGPLKIQVDFECVEFDGVYPQEWESFFRSSPREDLLLGLRGAFHKFMLRAVTANRLHKAVVYSPVKRLRKEITTSNLAVSPKGISIPWTPTGEFELVLPIYVENKSPHYIRTITEAYDALFPHSTHRNTESMKSLVGLCKECTKWYSIEDRRKIYDGFYHTVFGAGAQSFYKNDPEQDKYEKQKALAVVSGLLDLNVLSN